MRLEEPQNTIRISAGQVTLVSLRQHAAARQPGGIVTCPENEQRLGDFLAGQVHLNTDSRVGLALQPKKTGRRAISNKACQDSYQPLAVYALQTDES